MHVPRFRTASRSVPGAKRKEFPPSEQVYIHTKRVLTSEDEMLQSSRKNRNAFRSLFHLTFRVATSSTTRSSMSVLATRTRLCLTGKVEMTRKTLTQRRQAMTEPHILHGDKVRRKKFRVWRKGHEALSRILCHAKSILRTAHPAGMSSTGGSRRWRSKYSGRITCERLRKEKSRASCLEQRDSTER